MEHILYWLWLTGLFGVRSGNLLPMVKHFGGIEGVYNASIYPDLGIYPAKTVEKLNNKSLDWAKRVYTNCEKEGIEIITFDSEDYPEVLTHIYVPPVVLYAKGKIPIWDDLLMISVVGTRYATEYGIRVTGEICTELSKRGVTIVSGFAKGIDAAATKGAVNVGAYNIGVCSCGLDIIYPKVNKALREAVLENGLLISEYPPGTLPKKWTFRPRNRIIAGLSKGVLVTEAPKKSGALITAHRALEENRDVFAVPGKIDDVNFVGVNGLIKSGAKPVFSADDILAEYSHYVEYLTPIAENSKILSEQLKAKEKPEFSKITKTGTEGEILRLLTDEDLHIDELMRRIGASANSFQASLFLLEICGDIKRLPGNVFRRIK